MSGKYGIVININNEQKSTIVENYLFHIALI